MTTPATHVRYRVVALATGARHDHVPRPGVHRDAGTRHHPRSRAVDRSDGYVFTVFQLAYALFEIPTAWWADRRGTRSVLSRIVLWWSCLTAATGAALNYPVLLAIRFLFGMGEAGAWPCVARTFSRWIPGPRTRKRAGRVLRRRPPGRRTDPGARALAAQLPVLARHLRLLRDGWSRLGRHLAHLVPQRSIGASRRSMRPNSQTIVAERPPDSGHAARMGILGTPRSQSKHDRDVRHVHPQLHDLLFLHHLAADLPETAARLRRHGLGIFAGLPLIVSMPGDLLGGLVTDRLAARYGLRVGRCGLGAVAYVIAGIALLAAAASSTPIIGRRPYCAGDRHDDVHARGSVGDGDRVRSQPRGCRGRDDELGGKSGRDAQPADRRLLGPVVR